VGGSQTTDQRNHNYVNEITRQTITGNATETLQYDANGNTLAASVTGLPAGRVTIQYDALNRPIQINRVSDGLVIATYVFDAFNRRVRKTISNGGLTGNVPNGTTDYIWLGSQVMEERNSSNAPILQYVWGTYIDECIQITTYTILGPQNVPAGAYYLLQDLLYRAIVLTNSSGAIVEAYDCDAYGNTLIFTAPDSSSNWWSDAAVQSSYGANEIIYCGYRYDPEAELYYMRARTYSSTLGRWMQRDPIEYEGGINLYEYVNAMPETRLDPLGMTPDHKNCCHKSTSPETSTTVSGLMRRMIAGRGHFLGTLSRAGNTGSYISLSFLPSSMAKKCCDEIEFIQFVQESYCLFLGGLICNSTAGWILDDAGSSRARVSPPFYPYQFPWTKGGGSAMMTDNPGFSHVRGLTSFTFFSQNFATFVVCTRGKEAGSSYGEEVWGHVFHLVGWLSSSHSTVTRNLEGAAPPSKTASLSASMTLTIQ
jgi:RHS repeat-associated protein